MARFGMESGERGSLQLDVASDGVTHGYFVPREPPAADSPAAKRLAAGAKLLEVPTDLTHLKIFPLDTRSWRDEFLGPKYSKILAIDVPMDLDSDWDIADVLENLPSGFTKDYEYRPGLARECAPLIDLLEDHTDCSTIEFVRSGVPKVVGNTFEISFQRFDALRAEFTRIKSRGDFGIRRVRDHFVHNDLASSLGLEPQHLSLGRLPTLQWITRVASGETPLSEDEQTRLVTATLASAPQIAAEAPAKIAQLQREIEMVNLEQPIARY